MHAATAPEAATNKYPIPFLKDLTTAKIEKR
jgi:hypothetical protein